MISWWTFSSVTHLCNGGTESSQISSKRSSLVFWRWTKVVRVWNGMSDRIFGTIFGTINPFNLKVTLLEVCLDNSAVLCVGKSKGVCVRGISWVCSRQLSIRGSVGWNVTLWSFFVSGGNRADKAMTSGVSQRWGFLSLSLSRRQSAVKKT